MLVIFSKNKVLRFYLYKICCLIFLEKGIPSNRKPSIQDRKDIEKAINIHNLMSKADIGQSLVVVNGLCIGLETLPGTDAMIEFVKNFKRKNNFFKNSPERNFI